MFKSMLKLMIVGILLVLHAGPEMAFTANKFEKEVEKAK